MSKHSKINNMLTAYCIACYMYALGFAWMADDMPFKLLYVIFAPISVPFVIGMERGLNE